MVDKEKIKDAKKKKDGWWASLFSGTVANLILPFIADVTWITPNLVTTFSLALCFVACFYIASGEYFNLIIGGILVQFVFVFDCLDGQLARYRNASSNFGAWYDRVTDRVKDFILYFSLAWGHFVIYENWIIWPLAMTSLFFVYLFDYYVNQDIKLEARDKRHGAGDKKKNFYLLNIIFSVGEKVYQSIPVLQFHIGEQYLFITLFLIFNKIICLFYTVIILGIFYAFYWPFSKYYGRKPIN